MEEIMRIKKALFLGTLCTAVSGMSLFAQAGVSYAKSAKEATDGSIGKIKYT